MSNYLFVCNTPYQILVSMWIRYHYFHDDNADILINNKLKNYQIIQKNLSKEEFFNNVLIWDDTHKRTAASRVKNTISGYIFAKSLLSSNAYDGVFSANLDFFVQRVLDFGKRRNKDFKFYYFEDGIASYSKRLEGFYNMFSEVEKGNISHNNLGVRFPIKDNMNACYMFFPDMMEWKPNASIIKLDHIDKNDEKFKEIVNNAFGYYELEDSYNKKYIFFEEAFYADTGFSNDVELVEKLAKIVGKENMFIKIHPRNPENRFEKLGFETNKNTIIPWEILALNIDLSDKHLITIASTSILASTYIFDIKAKSYSLINCLDELPSSLSSSLLETTMNLYSKFDNIKVVGSLQEIE